MEKWLRVPDFPNYKVSNLGNVYNFARNRPVSTYKNNRGYVQVDLNNKGIRKRFLVHRLVAMVFLKNKEQLPCVNHKDGTRDNNKLENLEWVTYEQNSRHGLGLVDRELYEDIKVLKRYFSHAEISRVTGLARSTIQAIIEGRTYKEWK